MRSRLTPMLGALVLLGLVAAPSARAQQDEKGIKVVPSGGFRATPERLDYSEELMRGLRLPPGFTVGVFARGLQKPRMMEVGDDGTVYVTDPAASHVVALRDKDGDGRAESITPVVQGLEHVHGITIHKGNMYLVTIHDAYVAEMRADGSVGEPRRIISGLPDGGQHPNRTIGVGPDEKLYITVGSVCNACDQPNESLATMLRFNLDGSGRSIYADGLRNTVGFGWHPQTRELWGMDHGSDWRGNEIPPEELNRIVEGGNYGWPYCWGDRHPDEHLASSPKGMTKEQYCARTVPPVLTYQAHSAPIQMAFYQGSMFPAEYRGDAFVAMRGSWNRLPPTGYKVVRIRFRDGQPQAFEDFLTGFLVRDGRAHFARLAGVTVARDGALLVGDDTNGVVYRIAHRH